MTYGVIRSVLCGLLGLTVLCLVSESKAWNIVDGNLVDPSVNVTNRSEKRLLVKWQTSIPGIAASPVEAHEIGAGVLDETLKHANFWVVDKNEKSGTKRDQPNVIEIWVYAPDDPNLLLATYRTFRYVYPENLAQEDKALIMAIEISKDIGINLRLEPKAK